MKKNPTLAKKKIRLRFFVCVYAKTLNPYGKKQQQTKVRQTSGHMYVVKMIANDLFFFLFNDYSGAC